MLKASNYVPKDWMHTNSSPQRNRTCTQRKVFTKKAHCLVYTWYIYLSLCSSWTLLCPFRLPGPLGSSDLDALRIRCVLATDRPPMRGWGRPNEPKFPKPSADLINMAAFPRGRACTIGTPTLTRLHSQAVRCLFEYL